MRWLNSNLCVIYLSSTLIQNKMPKYKALVMRVQEPLETCYTGGVGTSRRTLGPTQISLESCREDFQT